MSLDTLMNPNVVFSLWRPNPIKDQSGGFEQNFQKVLAKFHADFQDANGKIRLQYAQQLIFLTNAVYTVKNIQARAGDIIRSSTGRTFLVHGYCNATAGRDLCWRTDCEEQFPVAEIA